MDNDLAVFKAGADATRPHILFLLAVCELMTVLEMPQGRASPHLGALKHAGLVRDRRQGTWIQGSLAQLAGALSQ